MYGHVARLAEEILKGVQSVEGVEAKLWQVRIVVESTHKIITATENIC